MPSSEIDESIVPSIAQNRPLWSGLVLMLALTMATVTLLTLLIDTII